MFGNMIIIAFIAALVNPMPERKDDFIIQEYCVSINESICLNLLNSQLAFKAD